MSGRVVQLSRVSKRLKTSELLGSPSRRSPKRHLYPHQVRTWLCSSVTSPLPRLEDLSPSSETFRGSFWPNVVKYVKFNPRLSHLLPAREGSQRDVGLQVSFLIQSDHLRAGALLPSRRSQVVDQFQCCRLVDSVGLGPVDTNLEGFLQGGGGTMEGVRTGANQMEEIRKKNISYKQLRL